MSDGPPSQSSIDALNTATPILAALADIAHCTYMHGRWIPHINWAYMPWILLHHTSFTYRRMHIYTRDRWTPLQSSMHALNTTTPGDLSQRTSTYERPFTREGNYLVKALYLHNIYAHATYFKAKSRNQELKNLPDKGRYNMGTLFIQRMTVK